MLFYIYISKEVVYNKQIALPILCKLIEKVDWEILLKILVEKVY